MKGPESFIFQTVVRYTCFFINVLAVYLMLRGHNLPGGGFIAGLASAISLILLSLATGLFYFTWVSVGLSLSLGLAILIIGIPFVILFIGSVRVLSLVEGRLVEAMLGVRMPRRPIYADQHLPLMTRIKEMFVDPRSWATMLYMLAMCPLGIIYFTIVVTALSLSFGLIAGPAAYWVMPGAGLYVDFGPWDGSPGFASFVMLLIGIVGLFATLHLSKGIGYVHGHIAKHLLVKEARD